MSEASPTETPLWCSVQRFSDSTEPLLTFSCAGLRGSEHIFSFQAVPFKLLVLSSLAVEVVQLGQMASSVLLQNRTSLSDERRNKSSRPHETTSKSR